MKTRIYQIMPELDVQHIKFKGINTLRQHYGDSAPAEIYCCVYDGDLQACDLEEIYMILNTSWPADYKGHSLSVSDIVELEDGCDGCNFFYCDMIGFQPVRFRKEQAKSAI